MDEHRGHADDPDQPWYPGERAYRAPGWDSVDKGRRVPEPRLGAPDVDPYDPDRDSDPPRAPQRHTESRSRRGAHADGGPSDAVLPSVDARHDPLDPLSRATPGYAGYVDPAPSAGPSSFDALTGALPPASEDPARSTGPRFPSRPIDRASLRRPGGAPTEPVGDGVYRTRRPAVALAFAVITLVLETAAVRLLLDAAVGGPVSGTGLVSGTLLALGLPIFAAGLYAMVTSGRATDRDALLRPPLGYLTVGLVLFLAAALATG